MNYSAIAYDSAAKLHLAKLDHILNQALRLACGAIKGTSAEAVDMECDEMSPSLRRLKMQIVHAVKVRSTPDHVAQQVYLDHWTQYYGKFTDNNKSLNEKVNDFFATYRAGEIAGPRYGAIPPWLIKPITIDMSLINEVSKKDAPNVLRQISMQNIDRYDAYVRVYTNASRTADGKVGIGCYIQSTSIDVKQEYSSRITDGVTVYTGEMTALRLALQCITQISLT